MRVLVAPGRFSGTLSAVGAAGAMTQGWRRHTGDDELVACPLADGGPGLLEALSFQETLSFREGLSGSRSGRGQVVAVTVPGPLGDDVPAAYLLVDDVHDGRHAQPGPVAFVESAQACGLHLVPPGRRNPGLTSTAGVGVLVQAAVDAGARTIVVGVGGAGTNDGGAGMLAALGAGPPELLGRGGLALADLPSSALAGLAEVRRRLADVRLVAATDVDVPLLGFKGASASSAEERGATPQQAQDLDRALGRLAEVALAAGEVPQRVVAEPGAGAGGGLGFALMLLGAERRSGSQTVLDAVGFGSLVRASDLVLTGKGCFDWASLRGSVVAGVASQGLGVGRPVVVVAGQVLVGRREALSIGVESAYAVADSPQEVDAAMRDPAGTLAARVQRVARTWSPRNRAP